jgi:hypothetical protein
MPVEIGQSSRVKDASPGGKSRLAKVSMHAPVDVKSRMRALFSCQASDASDHGLRSFQPRREQKMTLDQMLETFQRASESSLQIQQDMFKQWTQQWSATPLNAAHFSADWMQKLQKRCMEMATESLSWQRQSLDSMYKSITDLLEQTFRLVECKTPEDYRHATEELRRKTFETIKEHSEAQLRELQKSAEKWFDLLPKV